MPSGTTKILTAGIRRHAHKLNDGRDLFYYDDANTQLPATRKPDTRDLPPRPKTAELRYDALTGEWISVATARQNRAHLPPPDQDPLAPSTPSNPSELPDLYDVAVFENRSPSFGPALADSHMNQPAVAEPKSPFGVRTPAVGRCEVICFSPEFEGSLGSQSVTRMRTIVEAWADRDRELSALAGVQQVFPFENRGEEIGVTLPHPHGQIYAYPFIPPRTQALLRQHQKHGPDFLARLIEFETQSERVLYQGNHWVAYVPFAARWPIEIHVRPWQALPNLASTPSAARDELSELLPPLLHSLDELYVAPAQEAGLPPRLTPYIAAWHQAPKSHPELGLALQITSPRRALQKLKF